MKKPVVLLSIAALASVLNRASAVGIPKGNGIAAAQAAPHALARAELLARAIACEDMPCLERKLDEKLIYSAVRPFMIIMSSKKRNKNDEKSGNLRHCWTETPCYYRDCAQTCSWWQAGNGGGVRPCHGTCGRSKAVGQIERSDDGDGGHVGGGVEDGSAGGVDDAHTSSPPASTDNAQEDTSERYMKDVRARLLQLTRSCARIKKTEAIKCMQSELDAILARAFVDNKSCPIHDKYYYCQCKNTCCYWQRTC